MELTIKGKTFNIWSKKRILYTLCFFMFCLIDQRTKTGSGLDGYIETFRNMTGSIMAVLLLSHCKWGEIRAHKLPYLLWTILGGAAGAAYAVRVTSFDSFVNGRVSAALSVLLFGYALIHTVIRVAIEKKYPSFDKKFLAVWGVMMLLMIFSRSDYVWPLCYFLMFGCFYLTDFTAEEREDLFQGCMNGIILGFFVFQGFCCVFRPYDSVRYQGIYNNPNLNALFYLEVLAAVFAKILYVTKNRCNKWIRLYYWLGAGVVLTFELLTIGRTGWVVAVLMIGCFLWMICKLKEYKKWFKNLMVLSLCVLLTFPICFSAIRYLPPVFHHPVWFWGEWNEGEVHSWDPWNSEKFVDIDEYMDAALGRIFDTFENALEYSPFAMKAEAAEAQTEIPANKIPLLQPEQDTDTLLVRSTIYKYYISQLNLTGHPYSEQGFQLHPYYWVGHAHNIFLQYGTDFGVPMMLLFAVLVLWSLIKFGRNYAKMKDSASAAAQLFVLIPVTFGLLEYSWGVSSLTITMLFIAWRKAICDGE